MLRPEITRTKSDLEQILQIQQENLIGNIDVAEMQAQGFVTMHHDLEILHQMHDLAPSIIIKDDDQVAGYALTMLRECRRLMPGLESMFALLDTLNWKGKPLNDYRFYVMGQVCIAKQYRGRGLFEQLFEHHKKLYGSRFDLFITEIATRNHRSIRAHEKVGFKPIHTHRDELDEWVVVAWDWN
jgi:GNAT superfamily N-acetyltransferase